MQQLRIISGDLEGKVFALIPKPITIGREPDNLVCMDEDLGLRSITPSFCQKPAGVKHGTRLGLYERHICQWAVRSCERRHFSMVM